MKKRLISKSLIAKIALVLVIILLFEFALSEPVHASAVGHLGGTLLTPVVNLVVYLADGVISILQSALLGMSDSFIYIDLNESGFWKKLGKIVLIVGGVLALVAVGVLMVASGGAFAVVVGPILIKTGVGLAFIEITAAVVYKIAPGLKETMFGKSFVYSSIKISPESILKNEISFFDIDFFTENTDNETDTTQSITSTLRTMISQVYNTVRDIALVAMLIVIIYVAIRMLLALTPKEKSRYKESAVNCIIGLILIVVMHYIMSISITLVNMITSSINAMDYVTTSDADAAASSGAVIGEAFKIEGKKIYKELSGKDLPGVNTDQADTTIIATSTFTEQARYRLQKIYDIPDVVPEGSEEENNSNTTTLDEDDIDDDDLVETWEHIGWALVYIMLVILTLAFVWMYGKRVVYVAVLIILAPIVGVWYPINRVNGARAHTLNLWFKEFMGNLVIQPLHIFLYTILIGGAMELALANPIYVIVAIMGLVFVENLVKDLLGVQDTRMGNLGRALQDTTRAIKGTERMATSIARTVGRTASRGINAVSGAIVSGASARNIGRQAQSTKYNGGVGSEEEEEGANQPIREQQNPLAAEDNGGNNLPPPAAGAQDPAALGNELDDDVREPNELNTPDRRQLGEVAREDAQNPGVDRKTQLLRDKKQLEELIKEEELAGNGDGMVARVCKAKLDDINTELASLGYNEQPEVDQRTQALLSNKRQLEEAIKQEEAENRGDGMVARLYRENLEAVNTELATLGNDGQSSNTRASGSSSRLELESDTVSAINDLNSGTLLKTDGTRNIMSTDNDKIVNMEINDSDPQRPLAMAVNAEEYSSSSMNPQDAVTSMNVGDTNAQIQNNGGASIGLGAGNNSGATTLGVSGGSTTSVDSSNIRTSGSNAGSGNSETATIVNLEDVKQARNEGTTESNIGSDNSESAQIYDFQEEKEVREAGTNESNEGSGNSGSTKIANFQEAKQARELANSGSNASSNNNASNAGINNSGSGTSGTSGNRRTIADSNNNASNAGTNNSGSGTSGTSGNRRTIKDSNNNGNNAGANNSGANNSGSGNPQDAGNAGTNPNNENTANTNDAENGNQQDAGNSRPDTNSNNGNNANDAGNGNAQDSGNSGSDSGSSNTKPKRITKEKVKEKVASGIQKADEFVETAGGRAVEAAGIAVEGVIDTALNAVSGNIGGTAGAIVGTASDIVGVATGQGRSTPSGGGKSDAQTKSPQKRTSQNVQTIMKETGLSEQDAKAIEEACKRYKIMDDRDMAEAGKVWKRASESDKSKIFELTKVLIEVKRDGGSQQDAEKALENARVGSSTKDLLLKMYKNLHG